MNLPERDFKIKIINMLMEVQKNIQELREEFWLEIQSLWNTVLDMKHTMQSFKSRLDMVEEMINELEIRGEEYKQAEAQKEKRISKSKRILRELCDQSKRNTICIIGVPEEEERKGIESVFEEVIAENFPNLGKESVSQAMEVHRSPKTRDPRNTTRRHIIIKMAKINGKDRGLKPAKERKKITYKGKPIRLSSDFSTEIVEARRQRHDIFKAMKQNALKPRVLYASK